MQKLLSFAVPTYNMEDYLEKCVRSCVCENMNYLEILIVNDGSKDNSLEIAYALEHEFPDVVRVFDKENGNYGTCVNRALSEATGKYFKMLDPDDWVDTEALNTLLEKMKTVDADLFVTVSEDRQLGKKLIRRMSIPDTVTEGKIYDAKLFDGIKMKAKWLFCSHVLTYRTQLLKDINLKLKANISYTDNEFVFYPLDNIDTMVFYDLPLYQYYVGRTGSSTINADVKMQSQMWIVLKDIFDYYFNHFEQNNEAVRNNQRIVIANMVEWIFHPIFRNLTNYHENIEMEKYLYIIQPYVSRDAVIQKMISRVFKKRNFDLYNHYIKTGKLRDYSPKVIMGITYRNLKMKCIRLFNVLTSK